MEEEILGILLSRQVLGCSGWFKSVIVVGRQQYQASVPPALRWQREEGTGLKTWAGSSTVHALNLQPPVFFYLPKSQCDIIGGFLVPVVIPDCLVQGEGN